MSDLQTVGTLLRAYPELHFYLGQYLLAKKHTEWLEERFRQYQEYLSGSIPPPINKSTVLDTVRRTLSQSVPAYGHLGEIEEFHDIPCCDKDSLRRELDSFISRNLNTKDLWCADTSGTTGQPVATLYSPRFYFEYLHLAIRKTVHTAGIRSFENYPVFCICIDNSHDGREFITVDPTHRSGVTLRLLVNENNSETLERLFHFVERLKPAVVTTRPTIFEALLAYASAKPHVLASSPLCVISAGSFLSEAVRQETEEVFGAKVFNCYGLTEVGLVACECAAQNGYHIDETSVMVEVLDPEGNPVDNGLEGEIVLSSFANEAMPLIRYKTGDFGAINLKECPCGRSSPRIVGIKGHGPFHYRFASGQLLHPARFNSLFWFFPVTEFQVIQIGLNEIELLIQPSNECDDEERLVSRVRDYVATMLPSQVEVKVRRTRFEQEQGHERFVTKVSDSTDRQEA